MHKTMENHNKHTQKQREINKTHKHMKLEAMIYKSNIKIIMSRKAIQDKKSHKTPLSHFLLANY